MNKGFSLIELVIVLAIAGILSAIAIPGYHDYITRAHRNDAKTALLDLAIRMENYYAKNNTYQTATIGVNNATDVLADPASSEGFYRLAISQATATTYSLEATPINTQATADTHCQSLTFNHLGQKGVSAAPSGMSTAPTVACW